MSKFKVGDRVRKLGTGYKGTIQRILKSTESFNDCGLVSWDFSHVQETLGGDHKLETLRRLKPKREAREWVIDFRTGHICDGSCQDTIGYTRVREVLPKKGGARG